MITLENKIIKEKPNLVILDLTITHINLECLSMKYELEDHYPQS